MLYTYINNLYHKKVDARGLSFFRIAIGLVLFAEVFKLLLYRRLVFDVVPYIEFSAILDYKFALLFWLLVILCLIFGLFTRIVVILNYMFSLVFFASITGFGNHMIQVFMSINFLLLFANVSQVWSLDAMITKLKFPNQPARSSKVSVLNYYSFVFVALGLVYFVSVFDKYFMDYWRNGMVFYKIRSLPDYGTFNIQYLLNQKWLMMSFAYITLAFETVFIFLCFNKCFRVYLCIIGIALHFGIFLFFPIPEFALGFMALYLLLVPFSFWRRLGETFRSKTVAIIILNKNNSVSPQLKIIIEAFDVFKCFVVQFRAVNSVKPKEASFEDTPIFIALQVLKSNRLYIGVSGIRFVLVRLPLFSVFGLLLFLPFFNLRFIKRLKTMVFFTLLNLVSLSSASSGYKLSLAASKANKKNKIKAIMLVFLILLFCQVNTLFKTKFASALGLPSNNERLYKLSWALFGITAHSVFSDAFDTGALYSVGISKINNNGHETWLPLAQKDGEMGAYKKGPLLGKSHFRSLKPYLDSLRLYKYTKDFTAFWSFQNHIDLDSADFNVYIKKVYVPEHWEKDVYKKNINKPWVHLGKVIWRDTIFYQKLDVTKKL